MKKDFINIILFVAIFIFSSTLSYGESKQFDVPETIHKLSLDKFEYNDEDSTCTLIHTSYAGGEWWNAGYAINRGYATHINNYKLIGIGDGENPLNYTLSIALPPTIKYINDYSLSTISGGKNTYQEEKDYIIRLSTNNDLEYIGAYAFPPNPFNKFRLHINKKCKVHKDAFSIDNTNKSQIIANRSNLTIDPENPYVGLTNEGILFYKDSVNIARYFIHEAPTDTVIIPKSFSIIDQPIDNRYNQENIIFEDASDITSICISKCNVMSNGKNVSFDKINTFKYGMFSNCYFYTTVIFPNAYTFKSPIYSYFQHLVVKNVETLESGNLFYGTADTLSIYANNVLDTRFLAYATIGRLNWLNEDIPFCESIESPAKSIAVKNFGNAKSIGRTGLMYAMKTRNEPEKIILSTPTPPQVLSIVLYNELPSKTTLYVPKGSGETYRNHDKWGIIPNIIEYDVNGPDPTSGVENLIKDNTQKIVNVYNLKGMLIRKDVERDNATDGLPKGVYIIGNQKVFIQ